MLNQLIAAWRARRILLIGGPDVQNLYMHALIAALGARPARLPPDSTPHTLNLAMSSGRISAVIVPSAHALCPGGGLPEQLKSLDLLMQETREAGIPLCILCSHEDVYAPVSDARQTEEDALLGGRTKDGLFQSILQLYADGFSRGLLGDAVSTIICRHAPCLGSGHESVRQYSDWCRAIMHDQALSLKHSGAQGTFFHPLDAALGALCLGASFYQGNPGSTGCFNIAPAAGNLCANRSACLYLTATEGVSRAVSESHPPQSAHSMQLSGAKTRRLCGYSPLLGAKEALSFLMEHERALSISEGAAQLKRQEQAERLLERLS